MEINRQAPVIASHEILICSSVERVWRILTDINSWQRWHPNITQAQLTGSFAPDSVFRWKSNGINITSTLRVIEPLTHLGWTGTAIGTKAVHTWTLVPQQSAVLVKTEEPFEGWLVRLFKKNMATTLEDSLSIWLESLKTEAESQG
jgi:uncharacterized protein YndB with AHSA1/START domain